MATLPLRLRAINDVLKARPVTSSMVITCVKAGCADLLVQTVIEQRKEIDRRRLATFFAFGCFYQGGFQYFLFNTVFERWFPGRALRPTLKKILCANAIADPVFFFPTFYTIKEMLGRERQDAFRLDTLQTALGNYYQNCFKDWRNTWTFWLPGHAITYGIMPMHLRMPWVAGVSFGYVALLSFTRGAAPTKKSAEGGSPSE